MLLSISKGVRVINGIKQNVEHVLFNKKLRRVASEIRAAAEGRTCSNCKHCRGNWCSEQLNVEGSPLAILYESAPACGAYAEIPTAT